MRFEKTDVWGFEHAVRGMRNPLESWDKSDSEWKVTYEDPYGEQLVEYVLGENDINLAQRLIKAGGEHRKFMRQVFVSVDITAPLFWWKEFDTYKVGTVANSTSTMHKLATTPITIDCFEIDDYDPNIDFHYIPNVGDDYLEGTNFSINEWFVEELIDDLEKLRQKYLETKDKRYWKELIRWLPESWLQTRTVTMNYENILNICRQRKCHKLSEWNQFIEWAHALPYAEQLLFYDEKRDEE